MDYWRKQGYRCYRLEPKAYASRWIVANSTTSKNIEDPYYTNNALQYIVQASTVHTYYLQTNPQRAKLHKKSTPYIFAYCATYLRYVVCPQSYVRQKYVKIF